MPQGLFSTGVNQILSVGARCRYTLKFRIRLEALSGPELTSSHSAIQAHGRFWFFLIYSAN